jgi:hypothetical protein
MVFDDSVIGDDDGPEDAPVEKAYCTHKCPICRLTVPKGSDCKKGCHVECYDEQDSNSIEDDGSDDYMYSVDDASDYR